MRLSKRLRAIADFIDDNLNIIDIGCDHALLDIYLYENKKNVKIIASDINDGALSNAKKNLEKYKMEDKIILRKGNGLKALKRKNEINTIILSGMGYHTIKKILSSKDKLSNVKNIIVQSNTDIIKLRKYVIKLGYKIEKETLVKDKDIIYTVIKFVKGEEVYSYEEIYFGPKILKNKDELFYEYYEKKLLKYENLLLQLPIYEIRSRLHHKKLIKIIKKEVINQSR